ncbi:hypothetical protein MBANPS3_007575 [Mucor bainieri]
MKAKPKQRKLVTWEKAPQSSSSRLRISPRRIPRKSDSNASVGTTEDSNTRAASTTSDTSTLLGYPPVRTRELFSTMEKKILEQVYKTNQHPTSNTRSDLASDFDTTLHRITTWFHNRNAQQKICDRLDAQQTGSVAIKQEDEDTDAISKQSLNDVQEQELSSFASDDQEQQPSPSTPEPAAPSPSPLKRQGASRSPIDTTHVTLEIAGKTYLVPRVVVDFLTMTGQRQNVPGASHPTPPLREEPSAGPQSTTTTESNQRVLYAVYPPPIYISLAQHGRYCASNFHRRVDKSDEKKQGKQINRKNTDMADSTHAVVAEQSSNEEQEKDGSCSPFNKRDDLIKVQGSIHAALHFGNNT